MSSAEQEEEEENEEDVVEALPIELWEFLVLPRLRPSETRAVGRCGGITAAALYHSITFSFLGLLFNY